MNSRSTTQSTTDGQKRCFICLSAVPIYATCRFNPCSHQVACLNCVIKLGSDPRCPLCRASVESITACKNFESDGVPAQYSLETLIEFKNESHQMGIDNIPTVLVIGSSDSGKADLMGKIMKVYALANPIPEYSVRHSEYGENIELLNGQLPLRLVNCPVPWKREEGIEIVRKANADLWKIRIIVVCAPLVTDKTAANNTVKELLKIQNYIKTEFGEHIGAVIAITCENNPVSYNADTVEEMEKILEYDNGFFADRFFGVFPIDPNVPISRGISSLCNMITNINIYLAADKCGVDIMNLMFE